MSRLPRARRVLISLLILGGASLATVLLGGAATSTHMAAIPQGLDYGMTRPSNHRLFRATYTPSVTPIPIGRLHSWTLHLETLDGQPIEGARIEVDGDMPQHGHGLPTRPVADANLGHGNYRVDGLRYQMGGWWVMDFKVSSGQQTDTVRFNLMLEK